jgi:hypothetical protein
MTLTAPADGSAPHLASPAWRHPDGGPGAGPPQYEQMPLERAAWLTTVLIALATAVLMALEGYTGYAVLSVAVGASAAINLF